MSHTLAGWEGEGDVDRLGRGGVDRGHLRTEVKTRDGCFAETVENVVTIVITTALREPATPPSRWGVSGEWLDLTTLLFEVVGGGQLRVVRSS